MKKFMIFLLMAFLYLGTCQARSEASHPNNAKLKLLSWVSPTPSQSFLTPSATPSGVDAGVVVTSVAIAGAESGCPDQDITLTAVVDGPVTTSGASGLNFLWKIDGEAAPGTNNEQTYEFEPQNIAKLSDGQIHEFTVDVSGEGCALTVSPVHPFQMLKVKSIVTGPAVACENDNLTMTASLDPANSSLPLPTVTAWKWFQGGSSTPYATTSENTITLPQTVIGSYNWHAEPIFESGHGCTNSFTPWNASTVIITKFTGALTLALDAANPSPVCEGSNVKLNVTNSLTPSTGFTPGDVTYEWYMDENLVATTTATSYTTTLTPGFHNFYVKAIYANYDCSELKSAPVTVEVKTVPALAIVGDNVICAGQTTNNINVNPNVTGATYTWTKPDNSTATGSQLNANMPGHYVVSATMPAAQGGCTATADFTVYQFGGDLQVSATEYNVCPGEVVALNANLQGWTNENINYTWTAPSGITLSSTMGSTVTATIPTTATPGAKTFNVTATAANGCSISYNVVVNVIDPTNATFTVNLDNTQICVGGQVEATANLGSYTGLVDWYVNGILVPGEHASVITMNPTEAGTFTFAATPANTTCTPAVPSTAATATNTVTVYPKPVVTITGDHVICQGATATLTRVIESYEASTAGGYILPYASYQWYGPEAWTGDDDSWSTTTDVPGVFTLEVTWQGAGLETCAASAQFVVTQLGGDLQVYASEQNVCPGTPVMLNANLDGFGNEMISYEWDYNSDTTSTITVAPTTTTTYHVTATAADMEMTGTCEMESYITVNVINETAVTPTVTLQTAQNICEGGIATVKATATDVNYYTWYLNGIEVPGQNLPTITMNLFAPGTYTFAAKPVYTCLNPAPTPADKVVTVYAVPEVTVTGNNVICQGASTTLTANITLGSGNYTVNWTGPKTGTGTTLTTNLPGVYTATVTDNTSGCIATADFTVYAVGADLQLTADKMEICKGDMVVLNANLDGFNNENVSYAWTGEGLGSIATGSTVTATPTSAGVKKYVVTATAGGCTMKDSLNINVIDVVVVTSTVANVAALCQGEQLTLTATPNPTGVATEFIWYMNGVEIPGENQLSITMNMDEAGTYTFAAKANVEGCNTATASEPVTVTVYPTPVVTLSGDHYYTTDATSATITASVTPAGTYTYAWSNGETGEAITVSAPGSATGGYGVYTVTVTSAANCTAISEPFTVSSVVDLQANITGAVAACQHDVVTLSAVVDYDLEGHTYQWLVNNQYITDGHGIAGATTANLTFPVDSLYTYYGEVLANEFTVEIWRAGCAEPVISPVHPFLINPVPYVYVAAPEKVCKGNDLTLEAVVYQLGENAQYQYIWFKNGTAFDTIDYVNTITLYGATLVDGDEFAVQVLYQDLACNSDTSDYVKVPFYVEPSPISLNIDPTTICTTNQASVWITDPNTDPENFGAVTYTWYVNGFAMPLAQSDTLVIDFDHNGAYTFWATASYANYPCALAYTDTLTENVVMHPTVAITGDPLICHGDSIQLYALINDTVSTMNYTYEWRLYNYTLQPGYNTITIGSGWSDADEYVNNGNVTFFVDAPVPVGMNDPWLTIDDINAQDYPYIFTVVVTTPEGCQVMSEPYYVYVNDSIHVVTTVDYDSVCAEGMITAVAHLGNWNADNLTAQWQVRTYDESTDTWSAWQNIPYGTSGILQHVPGVTSEYRIHVVQTTSGCEAYSEPVKVTVFQPINIHHIVAINHDDNYPTDNVCEGAQLDITAYIQKVDAAGNPIQLKCVDGVTDSVDANGDPVYEYYIDSTLTYMWTLNGMQLQTVHGPAFSAQAYIYDSDPVDYTYTAYIVYDIPGCELIPVASNTIHVKRNPIVTIEGNHNYCYFGPSYDNVILTAWVDGDLDPDATYKWYKNGEYRSNTNGYDNHYLETWEPSYDNPYIFTVEVTNGDGCTTISDPFEVNVYARPYTNITADADSICEGGYVTMRANLDNYNDPMLTYQWYKNEVNNTHILPGATHEIETFQPVLGTTDYIVKVTHLMDFNTQYCVAYDTFKILVNPIPVVTAVNDLNGEQSICEGRTVTMQATTTGGVTGGEYYTWYRNGEEILDIHSDVFVDAPTAVDNEPAQYVYSVKVRQSASGCESEVYFIDTITVNPNPSLELVTDPIVCAEGDSNVVLYANVDPMPATPVTYKWMEDNAVVATTTDSVYYFTKPYRDYPYSFAVELVNEYGCVAHADATVYVNAAPVVNITATETNICNGGEITVTATLNDWNADQLTYQWYDGTTMIPGATELSYTVVPAEGIHKYNIQIDQLTSLCHATSDTIVVTVNADPTVVINYAADQYTVCDGYQVDLTTTVTGGVAGGEVYTWYRNGQVIEGATAATYSEVVSALNGEPTTYNYAVSVAQTAAGCESNVYDQLATITVNPNPVVMLVTDPIVCDTTGNNITLTANLDPANVGSAVTYKWMEDNAIMDPATYTVVSNNQITLHKGYRDYPYHFAVEVVNDYACSSTSEAEVSVNANPIVNTTVTENNICVGGEITMALNLNDWNADQLTFQWYDNGEIIPGATSLSYTVVPTEGNHEYFVKVFQLTSECEATSIPFTVVVNPIPVIESVVVSQYNVCYGAQLNITATPTDGYKDGEIYTWYRNGVLIPGAVTHTIQDTPGTVDNNIQHYTYTAVVTRPQAGCTSDMLAPAATSAQVTVYPNPVVVITGDQHVCETDSVFLIANVDTTAFPVGSLHYTWYESGQIRDNMAYNLGDNSFYAEYFYARTEPYIFTVNVERNDIEAGCASMSAEYYVYVYPQPVVNITATETQICTDGQVTLTANLNDYNADNIIYQWYEIRYHDVTTTTSYDTTDNYEYETHTEPYIYNIPGATSSTYTTNLTETTTLGVMVRQTNSECWANDEIEIIVNPIPVVTSVTVNGVAVDTVCDGAQVTVTATINANGTPGDAVYTWYRNGVLIPGATEAIFSENVYTTDNHVTYNYYSVVVTLPASGCVSEMSTMAGVVRINPAPSTVTISGINVLCENDSTTLTAYSDVEGEWTWSTGSHEQSITVPAGVYTVTMKTVEGCEMTSEPFTVEAFGTDLLVSATATSICRGEHTTLYVNQDGWQGNVTYLWDAQAGNSTATTVDVQPDSTTTYHVTATVSSTNGTCTAEGEVTIIVHQLPENLHVIVVDDTICQGQQAYLAAVPAGYDSYIWYENGVEIEGENQPYLYVNENQVGFFVYAAKAINTEGCVSAQASDPVTVTVLPAPTTVTITGNNVLCMTDSTTLTAHSDVEGIFTWNNGHVGATQTVAAGVYNVTITTAEGCHLTSENFTVESFGTDVLVSASATSICQGEHTTLYVDQDGWQGNVTYAWDAQAGNSTATTVDVQPAQTTTYHVTATVVAESGSCTAEGEVTIIVHPLPAQLAVNATTATTICQGDQVSFHATGDSTTTAYIWYQNGVEIPGENQADLTVNYNEYGTYSIAAKAISNEGCISALASEPVVVTVKPAPTTVTITGNNVLCMTDSTTLTAHSDVEGTFTWNNGHEGATMTVAAGVYNVTITTAEGCHLTSDNFTVESFGTDVLVSASATAICQGEHTTLYVNQDGWQGNVTYQWDAQAGNSTATTVDVQPAATTTYHVTATVNAESGSCTAVGEVTIIVNPLPVVAAVTATDTVVCEGTQVTFTATGDANTTAYIWYNNGVEIPGENQASLTVNFNEQGVYNYAVKAISNEGCVSAIAINAPVVTVNAAPESVVISGNTVICNGGFTTLYANVVPNLPATYEWFKDNVSINANTESIVVTTAGSYKVVASFNGCSTESDAVVVTVEQAPQLQLTAEETTFCAGGSTVITAEATGWNNADVNYNWSNGFQGSAYTFNPAYSGTYTFVVTASQATSGCVAVDSITINVNELPAIPQVTVDNAVVCDGGQITLTVTNPNNNAVYTWYRNGVVIAGANGPILTESPVTVDGDATNYVYNVTATLPMSGCTSIISSNTVVTVIPTPVVAVSVEGNTTLCAGGSTILHANVTPANANYNYQWYKDNVLIEGATTADYVAAEAARETAYMYHVVVTANAGCNVTAYAPAITFVADPVVEATISNNISCVGGTATLTPIVDGGVANVNGLNGYTFEWFRNNPNSTDPNNPYSTTEFVGNTPIYTTSGNEPAGNYTYWVTVTSNYGCQSTSAPVTYSVVADPVVTIVVAQGYPTTVCNGGASMLKANVSGGYGTPSYQWYKNGNLLVGETNQTLNLATLAYGVNDTYTVEVTQTGVGCSNSASAALNTLVTVNPTYTVNITGFGNVCEGGTLTLNATVNGVISGDVLSYQWYKISNGGEPVAISGANAAQYSTTDLLLGNSYDYYVVVTSNISGCSVVSNSVPANVVPAPTVAIQGASTVCEGGDLTLNAFVSGGVDGAAYTYTWTWTGAANGTATTAVPTFVPTVPANDPATPYYFTVTISRNDNTGCTATSEAHEVNVLAIPTVSVTADNSYICQNGQVTFTAHVSPVGAYNYVWTINGQQQAVNAATVTTTMATTGTITASVVVSAANASASCSASATIANPVNVVAVPTVTLAANHTTMCVGGVTTLTATVNANNNIPGNFNYEWIVDGTPVAGVTNTLNQTLTAAGIHHYQVRVFQNNELGCASTWSNEATVQVAEQPVVNLTSEDGLAICEGGSITLTGIVTNYGNNVNGVVNSSIYGNMTFDWTSNGVNVHHNANINNAQNQVTETLNNVGNYTYQVTVTPTGYNCQPQISNEYTVNVVSDPSWTDVHVYSNNGTDACLGEMVYLMAGIQGGVGDYVGSTNGHIQWIVTDENGNTANVNGGLGGNSYDIPTVAGTYIYTPTFVGNIGNGCQLTNTSDVQVAVTVHDLPTAAFVSGDSVELCANDPSASAELVINFTGVAPFTYQVVDGNGNIVAQATTMANTVSIYVAPSEQTTYFITMVQDAYCENTALESTAIATVFVNEIDFPETFFVSGCDDNGQVTVTFNVVSGDPNAAFTVVFENGMTASGNIVNNTATFPVPSAPGDYDAVITIDGCSYNIVVRVLVGEYGFGGTLPIMDQRWNDVVVVNNNPAYNGGHTFVGFQWYHNGELIPGATYSNYQEKGGLNGFYSVELIEQDADGNMVTYMTCEMYFNSTSSVKVYPVPANVRQEITIELDLTAEELDGAVLDIYSVTGALINHVENLQPITKIEGFKAQGTYFGRILTGTNEIKTVKFVIVK